MNHASDGSIWWISLSLKKLKTIMKQTNRPTMWKTRDELLSPFSVIFDQIFDQHFPELKQDFGINFNKGAYPKVDIIDFQDSIEIHAEIAGCAKEDVEISVEEGILTISSQTMAGQKPLENGVYIVREIKRSAFIRSFRLGDKLDESSVEANFDDGLLKITIKKKVEEPKQVKKVITIK